MQKTAASRAILQRPANSPREIAREEIAQTIADFVRAARIAREAGYDGVEVMGSEGYLITQFLAPRTNQRSDEWGASLEGADLAARL